MPNFSRFCQTWLPVAISRLMRSPMTLIYKLHPEADWRIAEATGIFAGASVDITDGFIHFSAAEQVRETAIRHFSGQTRLVLVAVEAAAMGSALVWEASRGGALFPHLYGPLPMSAVRWVQTLAMGADHAPVKIGRAHV